MPITIANKTITIATSRLTAIFEGPDLVELRNPQGQLLAGRGDKPLPALTLRFTQGETTPLGVSPYHEVTVVKLGERVVHVHVADENGDACLRLMVDERDRLVVEPSAHTIRRNLCAVVWTLPGIAADLKLVAPFYQGCRQELTHPLVAGEHWDWPHRWEAGFVILQGRAGGFSVSNYDPQPRPKAVAVGKDERARSLSFHSEVHGPAHDSVAAGSIAWVIDTHEGDWQVPAGVYRDWLQRTVGADELRRRRPAWVADIRLALQWTGNNLDILDAVAKVIAPAKVLIHQSAWRADPYDVNYPVSMAEGAVAVARELSELDGPLAVGGEGLNEMTMRYQSFAQAHLFHSFHQNSPHLAGLDPVPVGDFLYAMSADGRYLWFY